MKSLTTANKRRLEVFTKKAGRGINRYGMIGEGERIMIGVSGGKDSLALCYALSHRLKHLPITYELTALHIDWREHPLDPDQFERIRAYVEGMGIPLRRVEAQMFPPSFKGRFDCYLCSRNKRPL